MIKKIDSNKARLKRHRRVRAIEWGHIIENGLVNEKGYEGNISIVEGKAPLNKHKYTHAFLIGFIRTIKTVKVKAGNFTQK